MQARNPDPTASLGAMTTFGIGAVAGIITVYTTMPFDTVKTRMQSLTAKERYTGTVDCARKIVKEEGAKAFWNGSTARLGRLVVSFALLFLCFGCIFRKMGAGKVEENYLLFEA